MQPDTIVLRPRSLVLFGAALLAFIFGLVMLSRHNMLSEYGLGTSLVCGSTLFVIACLRSYTVINNRGLLRVDLLGFRQRFRPIDSIEVHSEFRRAGYYGVVPQLQFTSDGLTISLLASLYKDSSLRQALSLLRAHGVAIPTELQRYFKLETSPA